VVERVFLRARHFGARIHTRNRIANLLCCTTPG
jgi:hypothetical protein